MAPPAGAPGLSRQPAALSHAGPAAAGPAFSLGFALASPCRPPSFPAPMLVHLLKSKLHRATVTEASPHYEGSLGIAEDLIEAAGLQPYERILCSNLENGHRFETYVIPAPRGSGAITLNGATAHLGRPGDRLTIMSFAALDAAAAAAWRPTTVLCGPKNEILRRQAA